VTPLLELRGVGYRYGGSARAALSGVSFTLRPGECVALLGPNGAGKSTLLRLLCGLRPGFQGEVEIAGQPLAGIAAADLARQVSLVPQEAPSERDLLASELVLTGLVPLIGAWSAGGERERTRVRQAMAETGTSDLAQRPIASLSGGELRRVLIARALLRSPKILVMDEPLASLDLEGQGRVLALAGLAARGGAAVLVALHDLNLALRHFPRALLLTGGELRADGSPSQVLSDSRIAESFGPFERQGGFLFPKIFDRSPDP
jgi:iron complex transport system ATP-binding protein